MFERLLEIPGPARVSGDVGYDHAFTEIGRGAARTHVRPNFRASDVTAPSRRATASRGGVEPPAIVAEQQNRGDDIASHELFDTARERFEDFDQGLAAHNLLQHFFLVANMRFRLA